LSRGLLTSLAGQSVIQHVYPNGAFELLWNIAQHAGNFAVGSGQQILPVLLFHLGTHDCEDLGATVDEARVSEAVIPYVKALQMLKERGFPEVFACSILPQDLEAAKPFNAVLSRLMGAAGVGFIDARGREAIESLLARLQVGTVA
jgi:hypothetical protein